MSTTIDSKVVEMRFDNQQFESGVKTSIGTLDKLKQSLKLDDTRKGMEEVGKSINNVKFDGISDGIESIKAKFSTLQIAGMAVVARLTNSAIDAGKKLADALISPIAEGGKRRALNIAQAKFQFEGLGMDIEKAMEDANYAVADTAYGLDSAAKAAAMFGASGVQAGDQMKAALRGISGVAAMTSSEYDDIANVFTTIAGNGRVMGENLNSLASRGVNAAAVLGKALGKSEADVRKMVSKGQISFDLFAKAMDDAFGEHAKEANRTFTGALSNIRAAMSKIGADIATPFLDAMIGPLNSIRLFFNKIRKTITPFTTELGEQFHVLADIFDKTMAVINNDNFEFTGLTTIVDKLTLFMKLGGVTNIVQGLANAFHGLQEYVAPIKEAFRNFFPETTASGVVKLTIAFRELTAYLQPSEATLEKIRRIFSGLFAALDIGRQILHALFTPLTYILQQFGILGGRVSDTAVDFADWLVSMRDAAEESQIFVKIANKITDVMIAFSSGMKNGLVYLKELISTLGSNLNLQGFDAIKNAFSGLGDQLRDSTSIFEKAKKIISSVLTTIAGLLGDIPSKLMGIFKSFSEYMGRMTNIVGSAVILDILRRMLLTFKKIQQQFGGFKELFKGIGQGITTAIGDLDSALIQLTNNLKSGILLKIASSVLILAVAMTTLASIDTDKLASSLGIVSTLLGEVFVTLLGLSKIGKIDRSINKAANTLITISASVLILAEALKVISKIPAEKLADSLLSVISLTLTMTVVMFAMSAMGDKLVKGAAGLISLATSVLILTGAMKVLSTMDSGGIAKGLIGIGVLLGELALFTGIVGGIGGMFSIGLGMMAVATAMVVLSGAMKILATMEWDQIGRGLVAIGVALIELAVGCNAMRFAVTGAAAMLIASVGLIALAGALKILSTIPMTSVLKGLAAIGIALVELAVGCNAMLLALPGALALAVASVGLIALATALNILAGIKFTDLLKGLVTIAGAMTAMTAIGTVAILAVPGLLALSAAFIAFSGGVVLLGIGISSIGTGLMTLTMAITMLGTTAPSVIQGFVLSLQTMITGMVTMLPNVAKAFGEAIISIAEIVAKGAPIIGDAIAKVLINVVAVIMNCTPQLADAFVNMVKAFAEAIRANVANVVEAFVGLLSDILKTFATYIPDLIEAGKEIVAALADGVGMMIPILVDAAFKAIIAFVNGLADAIEENVPVLEDAIDNLIDVIKSTLLGGLDDSTFIGDMIESGKNAVQGFINGLGSNIKGIFGKAQELGRAAVSGLNSKDGLDEHSPSVKTYESGANADQGLINGMEDGLPKVEKMGELLGSTAFEGADDAATAGGESLLSAVNGSHENILTSFAGYLSQLSVMKQEETNLLSEKRRYTVGSEQAYLNTLDNMRKKHQKQVEQQKQREIQNEEFGLKTLENMRNKYARQNNVQLKEDIALRKQNVDSKEQEANDITKYSSMIENADSKSGKSAKDASDKKKKIYAEMTKEEKAYWENILALHKNGAEAVKYADMDLLDFQESVVEEAGDLIDKYMEKYDKTVDDFMNKGGIFEAIKEQEAVSKEELQANLQGQIDQLNEYALTIMSLDQRLQGTRLQEAIQEMGVDSLQQLKALNSMTDEELNNYVVLYDTKYAAANQAAIGQLGGLQRETEAKLSQMFGGVKVNLHSFISEFDGTFGSVKKYVNEAVAIGGNISSGLAEGIAKNAGEAKDAAISTVDDKDGTTRVMKDELDINSPSGVARDEIGKMIDFGLRDGIRENIPVVRIEVRRLMLELVNTMNEYIKDFHDAGVNIANGIINGMRDSRTNVVLEAEAMAKAAYEAAKNKLKINSPSKMFYGLGKFSGIGLVNALHDAGNTVGKAGASMAMQAYERAAAILESGVDINPTISPILDLSNVEEGSKRINDLSRGWDSVSIGVSGNLASVAASNFNQTRAANIAENQNGLDLLRNAINALGGGSNTMTQNNTFNISGDDPRAIADEVSRVLQMQVERRGAVWA